MASMTLEIALLFLLLGGMVFLFLTERLPVDLTAFAGLVVLVLLGYVQPDEAFAGFASPAVITMLSVFIVGGAMLHTGLADIAARQIQVWVGNREIPLTITIMLTVAVLSAFMNNIAATAVMMPAVAGIARQTGLSPSRLFMPLSFAAILGGTTTLIGTPPNILAAAMLAERGLEPFQLFDFAPVGLVLLAVGTVFMVTVGRQLLPRRETGPALTRQADLAQVYQLHERLFSIRVPEGSPLHGTTLAEARLGRTLGIQVVAIDRAGRRLLAPDGATVLRGGDVLLVGGRLDELRELLFMQSLLVSKARVEEIPRPIPGATGLRATLAAGSPLVGRSLRELRFRERFGAVVVGIARKGEMIRDALGAEVLREDDQIIALGHRSRLVELQKHPDFSSCTLGFSALQELQAYLYVLLVPEQSPLAGRSFADSRIGELTGVTIGGLIRGGETVLAPDPNTRMEAGDRLLVAGEPSQVMDLLRLGEVILENRVAKPTLESDEIGVVEATVAPRSTVAGKTLGQLSFRDRYGLQVLAIWREGRLVRTKLADLALRFGDALLLQGTRANIRRLVADQDFVVLTDLAVTPRRTGKVWFALAGLCVMVSFVLTGYMPIQFAAFAAATLVVLTGAITMEESYRAIEWRAIFLVAAVLPVGAAMERTGAALLLADYVTGWAGPSGPYFILLSLVVLASLLSQGLDGAPAVVLLTPVVIETASQLGLSPYPLMMGVALAASAAFMTPFSHKANLLVMSAGGYRSLDYLKLGTPLTVVLVILIVLMVPVFFPF